MKPNDPKLFLINRSIITKKLASHPLQEPNDSLYDKTEKAELFVET